MVEDLGGDGLDSGQYGHPRRAEPDREQVDNVLHDIALGIEIGLNIDCGIGDEESFGICRHVHDEDMADPPGRAQPGLAGGHLAHQLVGVKAPLHQQLALGLVDELHRLCGCRLAVQGIDDLVAVNVEAVLASHRANFSLGPTRTGVMRPAAAASIGPRSDVSSQG